jgi:uncharacterized protein
VNKLIIKQREFNGLVGKICRDIILSGWQPDYIVGITRGGLWPAVMISQYLNVPMQTLKVSLRDDAEANSESNLWMADDAFGYYSEGESGPKNILVVDDINDTGATLNWIMNDWRGSCLPNDPKWNHVWNNNVRFAVMVDNLASQCNVKMDFVGMEVNKAERDVWIEFPYEEWWTK